MNIKRGLIVLFIGLIVYFLYWINQTPAVQGSFSQVPFSDVQGKAVSINDYKGKFIFLDLYASWCIDCIKAAPHVKQIGDTLMQEGWMVIGITDDDIPHIIKWKEKYQLHYPLWHLEKHYKTMGVSAIPTYFVLDAKGKVSSVINAHEMDNPNGLLDTLRKIKAQHE